MAVIALTALAALAGPAGCDGDDGDATDGATADGAAPRPVEPRAEWSTPFCEAMVDLSNRLISDPPADPTALVVETYERIVDDVPPEIRQDFLAVLAGLQATGEAPAETSVPAATDDTVPPPSVGSIEDFADEGYLPDDDPALRLTAYVDATCRGTQNNPGPAATQPQGGFDTVASTVPG